MHDGKKSLYFVLTWLSLHGNQVLTICTYEQDLAGRNVPHEINNLFVNINHVVLFDKEYIFILTKDSIIKHESISHNYFFIY